jgi:hypothetical protein
MENKKKTSFGSTVKRGIATGLAAFGLMGAVQDADATMLEDQNSLSFARNGYEKMDDNLWAKCDYEDNNSMRIISVVDIDNDGEFSIGDIVYDQTDEKIFMRTGEQQVQTHTAVGKVSGFNSRSFDGRVQIKGLFTTDHTYTMTRMIERGQEWERSH